MIPTLVIADDSETIHKVIKLSLASVDVDIICVKTVSELEEVIANKPVHLICLDYCFVEELDGLDVAEIFARKCPEIKIMMLFGMFDQYDENKILDVGVVDKVVKPFDGKLFQEKVEEILSDLELHSKVFSNISLTKSNSSQEEDNSGPEYEEDTSDDSFEGWEVSGAEDEEEDDIEDEAVDLSSFEEIRPGMILNEKDENADDKDDKDDKKEEINQEAMKAEMVDWGVDVPPKLTEVSIDKVADESVVEERDIVSDDVSIPEELESESFENLWGDEAEKIEDDSLADEEHKEEEEVEKRETIDSQNMSLSNDQIKAYLEELVEKYTYRAIKEVVWDVVPDLAEKIITQEIEKIKKELDS